MTNHETLSKATKQLMLKEPFYGLFLITLNKVWRKDLDTAGVSKNGMNAQLAINPTFWENLSQEYKIGILKHEVLHIAFQHLLLRDSYKNKRLFNIAADLEINQYIDRSYMPGGSYPDKKSYTDDTKIFIDEIKRKLDAGEYTAEQARDESLKIPMRALFLEDFEDEHGNSLQTKMGTDHYYKTLEKTMDQNGKSTCESLNEAMGNGCDGNTAGHPGENHWEHSTWNEFDGLNEADKKLIQKQIDYQLKEVSNQVSKSRGTVPGEIKNYIDMLNQEEPAKFDWKGYLRMFTGGSSKTYTKKTRRKPSRRFIGSPGLRIKQKKHILVAIDTSGSVSSDELVEFFHEIHHMHKTGADVTVIQCDTAISHIGKYKKPEDGQIKVHGRGGTSFQPVIDYYNEHSKDFSCIVYFTDGEAPNPDPVAKGRMLWVLSECSSMNDSLPGSVIQLN
jgi:predicted metal-dependent peptidase